MIEIKPTNAIPGSDKLKIFLAGSIEMGSAERWQDEVIRKLVETDILIFNPRRDSWNSDWRQNIDNPDFRAQVEWELDALAKSDYIFMYFDPKTKSPISLLEMGLYARSGKLLVVCPDGFWRKGNVDIVCEKYGAKQFDSLSDLLTYFTSLIQNK